MWYEKQTIKNAFEHVSKDGWSVDHLRSADHPTRAVAIRPSAEAGKFDVTFSDSAPHLELSQTRHALTQKAASKLILTFFWGEVGHKDEAQLFINQNWRDVAVIKTTPTRVRIEYEMPNAGIMGGWQYYVDVDDRRYFAASI